MKRLSLVILTYNSERDIYDCLRSVYQYNDIGDALEVIVVDNNSPGFPAMQAQLKTLFPEVITIANTHNGGYGQGNNVGIRIATAPYIAIMNPDIRLIMPVFSTIVSTLERPDVLLCGGKQYTESHQAARSFCYDHDAPAILQSIGNILRFKTDTYDYRRMWLSGAFFAIQKAAFEKIGLFDERIFMYAEEFDIHIRLRRTFPHKKMVYLRQCKYLHLMGERPHTPETAYKTYRSDIYACEIHHDSPMKCIRRKKRTLRIMRTINIIVCALQGRHADGQSNYEASMLALQRLQDEYQHSGTTL